MTMLVAEGGSATTIMTFEVITCYNCKFPFAIPATARKYLMDNKDTFYCPNGHPQSYRDGIEDRLKKQLKDEQARAANIEAQLAVANAKQYKLDQEIKKQKRQLKRVQAGVCPCCNRTFEDLARHMKDMHPATLKDLEKPNPMHTKINAKKK